MKSRHRPSLIMIALATLLFGPPAVAQERLQIAVADLESKSPDISPEQVGMISGFLRDEIIRTHAVDVIERKQMEALLTEGELQLSGIVSDSAIIEMGKILPVSSLLLGSIGRLFGSVVVSVRLVDVETAETTLARNLYAEEEALLDQIRLLATDIGLSVLSLSTEVTLDDVRASMEDKEYRVARRQLDAYMRQSSAVGPEVEGFNRELNELLAESNYQMATKALRRERFREARVLINEALAVISKDEYARFRRTIDYEEQEYLLREERRREADTGPKGYGFAATVRLMTVNGFHVAVSSGMPLNEDYRIEESFAWYGGEIIGTRELFRPPNEGRAGFNRIGYMGLGVRHMDVDGSGSVMLNPYGSPGLGWGLKAGMVVLNLGLDAGAAFWFGNFTAEGYLVGLTAGGLATLEVKVAQRGGLFVAAKADYVYFPAEASRSVWEPRLMAGLVF